MPRMYNTRIKRDFLGFKWEKSHFQAQIIAGAFRPMGLMLWDCPPRTWMKQTLLGNRLQTLASWDPVPAELFMMAQSFEQIAKHIEEGIEPPTWPDFDSAHIGNLIRVELVDDDGKTVGPPVRVAMWGLTAS